MPQKVASMFTYMIFGYILGLLIGFTVVEPEQDLWALLGAVGGISGLFMGLLPVFRRQVGIAFASILGFYAAVLLAILIWGQPKEDDLLAVMERGGGSVVLVFIGVVIGAVIGWRLPAEKITLPAAAYLGGGFAGGAIFGVMLGLAPFQSMIGWSPAVILSGLAWGTLMGYLRARSQETAQNPA